MFEQSYQVDLLSDVVVTADAATVGGHQGLDFLPGSVFLGAAASEWTRRGNCFDPRLFLAGSVRFLDGLPLVDGQPSFPVPLSFHTCKGESWIGRPPLNLLTTPRGNGEGGQPKQWRHGYMSANGMIVLMARSVRMKTAIDRQSRRAAESQFFGYQSLPVGTTLLMALQTDTSEDMSTVRTLFDDSVLRLGRSKKAEYGRARVSRTDPASPAWQPAATPDGSVVIFLVSDLALVREGTPVLSPRPEDFGLPEGFTLDLGRTFLRSRRYSPWNGFFGTRVYDRQVLVKGSVVTFVPSAGQHADLPLIQESLASGVGAHRQEGLGQVLVNPPFLIDPPILTEERTKRPVIVEMPSTPLAAYLDLKRVRRVESADAFSMGMAWANQFSRQLEVIPKDHPVPGKSQWSTLREIAASCLAQPSTLPEEIREYCTSALRRRAWVDSKVRQAGRDVCLLDEILGAVGVRPDYSRCLALYHAAGEVIRVLARKRR